MEKSSTSIINHIPLFLAYYKKEGYSHHTQENYKRYLDRFVSWPKKTNKQDMKPHELSADDIRAYKLYLSHSQDKRGRSLKHVSQAYYLIALRAILGYFMAKDVVSPLPAQIILPRGYKDQKTLKHLTFNRTCYSII